MHQSHHPLCQAAQHVVHHSLQHLEGRIEHAAICCTGTCLLLSMAALRTAATAWHMSAHTIGWLDASQAPFRLAVVQVNLGKVAHNLPGGFLQGERTRQQQHFRGSKS